MRVLKPKPEHLGNDAKIHYYLKLDVKTCILIIKISCNRAIRFVRKTWRAAGKYHIAK